jgi:hypothetical protein
MIARATKFAGEKLGAIAPSSCLAYFKCLEEGEEDYFNRDPLIHYHPVIIL